MMELVERNVIEGIIWFEYKRWYSKCGRVDINKCIVY